MDSLVSHALRLLATRPHGTRELQQKLAGVCTRRRTAARASLRQQYEGIDCAAAAATVVEALTLKGMLDDVAYAKWHADQRQRFRPRSRLQLHVELRSKSLPSDAIAGALSGYDELAGCRAAAVRRPKDDDEALLRHLRYKAFPGPVIMQVLRERRQAREAEAAAAEAELVDDRQRARKGGAV
jgi:SOS response regulatory protein OraA/RecX